jgi:hypothetical protein
MPLLLSPNCAAPDEIYEALIAMHEGLDIETSYAVSARMILVLANHIGDAEVIREAARVARGDASAPRK